MTERELAEKEIIMLLSFVEKVLRNIEREQRLEKRANCRKYEIAVATCGKCIGVA